MGRTGSLVKVINPSDKRTRPVNLNAPQADWKRRGVCRKSVSNQDPRRTQWGSHLARDNDIQGMLNIPAALGYAA